MDTTIVPVQTDGLNRNLRRYDIQALRRAVNNYNLICKSNEDITNQMIRYALSNRSRKCGHRSLMEAYKAMIDERQRALLSKDRSFNTIEKIVRHDCVKNWTLDPGGATGKITLRDDDGIIQGYYEAPYHLSTEGSKWNENYPRSTKVAQNTRRNCMP